MQETPVQSLGLEDPLENGMTIHSREWLPGEFHGQRSLVGYIVHGIAESDVTERLTLSLFTSLSAFLRELLNK